MLARETEGGKWQKGKQRAKEKTKLTRLRFFADTTEQKKSYSAHVSRCEKFRLYARDLKETYLNTVSYVKIIIQRIFTSITLEILFFEMLCS